MFCDTVLILENTIAFKSLTARWQCCNPALVIWLVKSNIMSTDKGKSETYQSV